MCFQSLRGNGLLNGLFVCPQNNLDETAHSKHPVKGGPTIPFVADCAFADTAQIPERFPLSTAVVYECVSKRKASALSL